MKLRKHASTIVLVGLTAALGLYVFFVERGKATTSELAGRKDSLLEVFRPEDITSIHIDRDGKTLHIFSKGQLDGGGGLLYAIAPDKAGDSEIAAEQSTVDKLVQSLEMSSVLRPVESSLSAKELGLDSPRARIIVEMKNLRVELAVGNEAKTPAGAVYVEVLGRGRFVVNKSSAAEFLLPLESFRSTTVIPYLASACSTIQLDNGSGAKRMIHAPWGGFRLQSNGARVNRIVYDSIVATFGVARAERFLDNALADATWNNAKQKLTLRLEAKDASKPPAVVDIGGDCPAAPSDVSSSDSGKYVVVIRREPTRLSACAPAVVLQNLMAGYHALEDRQLFSANPDEVEELKITRGNSVVELARKGTGFQLRKPEERTLTRDEARGFVSALVHLNGEIISGKDPSSIGLANAKGTIEIVQPASGDQERIVQVLDIGELIQSPKDGGYVYVKRQQDGIILRVSQAEARLFEASTVAFRSTHLIDDGPEKLKRIATIASDGFKQTIARSEGGFSLQRPTGFVADGLQSENLFDALGRLDAERWVSERDDGSFGLANPRLTVTVDIAAEKGVQTRKLLIGDKSSDGSFARWDPDTGVFVLDKSVEDALANWLIDRSVFVVDSDEVESVLLETPGKSARLVLNASALHNSPDSGIKLTDAALARILTALTELRADGIVHTGEAPADEGFSAPTLRVIVRLKTGKGAARDLRFSVGKSDLWRTMNMYYVRKEAINATYAIASSKIRPLIEALTGEGEAQKP